MAARSTNSAHDALSDKLSNRISAYSLAAAAAGVSMLALVPPPAHAQIVYTPVFKTTTPNSTIPVDFNHDGTIDLGLRQSTFNTSAGVIYEVKAIRAKGVKLLCSRFGCPAPVQGEAEIGPSGNFDESDPGVLLGWATAFDGTIFGAWYLNIAKFQFLGVRFQINGETHYGWVRLKVDIVEGSVSGFAYETQANQPITAGDKGPDAAGADDAPAPDEKPAAEVQPANRQPDSGLGALALGSAGLHLRR